MDGWGASMDRFSLLVGMGPEQGILYLRPQRKQGILLPDVHTTETICL